MMPSRGIILARRVAQQPSHRNLSPRILQPSSRPVSARFASTSTPANTNTANIDTITFDNVDLSTASNAVTEGAGYLSSLSPSLNYGWGPTSILEWTLETLHFSAGLPWWGAIATTALMCRLATLPLNLKSQDQAARQAAMASTLKPYQDKINAAPPGSPEKMQAAQQFWAMRKSMGLKMSTMLWPLLAQSVVGFCGFRLTRAMAALPVPGFESAGFLWLQDLTLTDPYLLIPLIMGTTTHLLVRWGGETGNNMAAQPPAIRALMLYGLPGFIVVFGGFQPGSTAVWFAATTAFGMAQAKLLQNAATRRMLGVAPIYRPKNPTTSSPFADLFNQFSESRNPTPKQRVNPYATATPGYQPPRGGQGKIIDVRSVNKTPPSFLDKMKNNFKRMAETPDPRKRAEEAYEKRRGRR